MRRVCSSTRLLAALSTRTASNGPPHAKTSAFDSAPPMGSNSGERAKAGGEPSGQSLPDPLIYNVPTMCSRPVGRDSDILALWQHLLQGRRVQVISGVDGIGKSTIAAEFCACAKQSHRFTCVQWLDGRRSLKEQLNTFMSSMRGRKEKDVLVVLDNVADPQAVADLLPKHSNFFAVMTTPVTAIQSCNSFQVSAPQPLSTKAATELLCALDGVDLSERLEVFAMLQHVPLLVTISTQMLNAETITAGALLQALQKEADAINAGDSFSISAALRVLVGIAVAAMEHSSDKGLTLHVLAALASCHVASISLAMVDAIRTAYGLDSAETGEMAVKYTECGILSHKWDNEAFAMHDVTAAVLRALGAESVGSSSPAPTVAANALLTMWPRRWRGMSSDAAMTLVWHARALLSAFNERSMPLSIEVMHCLDRAATVCAHSQGTELETAAGNWLAMLAQWKQDAPSAERYRVGMECGKVLHHLRAPEAEATLRDTYDVAVSVYGAASSEAAMVLAFYGLYLPETDASRRELEVAEGALRARLASTDDVLSEDEVQATRESLAVLLMRRVQVCEALHNDAAVRRGWEELQALKAEMEDARKQKQRRSAKTDRGQRGGGL